MPGLIDKLKAAQRRRPKASHSMFAPRFHWLCGRMSGGSAKAISRQYGINPRELRIGDEPSPKLMA
jgi:hypothetical protein